MRMKASGMGLVPSREKACELVLPVLQRYKGKAAICNSEESSHQNATALAPRS